MKKKTHGVRKVRPSKVNKDITYPLPRPTPRSESAGSQLGEKGTGGTGVGLAGNGGGVPSPLGLRPQGPAGASAEAPHQGARGGRAEFSEEDREGSKYGDVNSSNDDGGN